MQTDMPNGSSNPFTDGHRAAERKATAGEAAKETLARDARIDATAARKKAAAKPDKPYTPYFGPR